MIQDWHTCQLDFVLAYPQAEVEGDIYMKLPKGFSLSGGRSNKTHILKLRKIYMDLSRLAESGMLICTWVW